jgi:hypothetical protein
VNIRKLSGALTPKQCGALQHAWYEARRLNRPLNRMLTIKPSGDLSPLAHAELVDWTWNKLGGWSRYHSGEFYCVLTREKEVGGAEHFHALIHVPPGKFNLFAATVIGWFPELGVADVKPAHYQVNYRVRLTGDRMIRSAIGYLTKQRSPQAAWKTSYSRYTGVDRVLGKRARISRTLLVPPTRLSTPVALPIAAPPQSEAA